MDAMSYPDWYRRASRPFRNEASIRLVVILDQALVALVAISYFAVLFYLALTADARFWKAFLVPAITFTAVTQLRASLDKPRPYELFDLKPLIEKRTSGKSFPSRHLASAVIIACALTWLDPLLAIPSFIACAIVAFTRIIGGVHFPRDIIAACAISLVFGFIGFLVVP